MEHVFTCNSAACIYITDINAILEQYDGFICMLARKNVSRPRAASADEIEKDIEDLAQLTRFKLWLAIKNMGCCHIRDMKAYIGGIARNLAIDLSRRYKPMESLLTNDEGEITQTYTLIASSQKELNPFEAVEQIEMVESYSSKVTEEVLELPHHQQRAMICSLKDQIGDLLSLVDMFQPHGIDVENMDWPMAENELRSSRTSLSIARKKLRATRHDEAWY